MDKLQAFSFAFLVAMISAFAVGCSEDTGDEDAGIDSGTDTDTDTDADAGALEIIGEYHEDWGAAHHVTAEAWTVVFPGLGDAGPTTSASHITSFDNGADFLVAQNDHELSYNPDLWSRYDWTYEDLSDGGVDLYYCQIEYAAADEEAAESNEGADPDDLGTGCSEFSWSKLIED